MNPLRSERAIENMGVNLSNTNVFPSGRASDAEASSAASGSRIQRAMSFFNPCEPQSEEPREGNYYVAYDRKKGPIGYIGFYKGKNNCMYRFSYNGLFDREYNGNKYLFRQVVPRYGAVSSSKIHLFKNRLFSIYDKSGNKLTTAVFLYKKGDDLIFQDDTRFYCRINDFNYELERELEGELEFTHKPTRKETEDREEKTRVIPEYRPSSNNNSNNSTPWMLEKAKTGRALKRLGHIDLKLLNKESREKLIQRAKNYENAGSSEEEPDFQGMFESMLPKNQNQNLNSLNPPPLVRLNSNMTPVEAAARYSLDRAGIYPGTDKYDGILETKKQEIRRRVEDVHRRDQGLGGSSSENVDNDNFRHRLGIPSFSRLRKVGNSLPRTRRRLLPKMRARELMRKTIKKLLPRARSRLRQRKLDEAQTKR